MGKRRLAPRSGRVPVRFRGNIAWGGTGKTPWWIGCSAGARRGLRAVVLSRGIRHSLRNCRCMCRRHGRRGRRGTNRSCWRLSTCPLR
ncbi:MAG: tetraacyldisaccharide 4'-kinase [Bilophila wadsworthia]